MTTYNTRNPLGSSHPKDLYDNAENLDQAINATGDVWVDRRGVSRLTVQGAIKTMSARTFGTHSQLTASGVPSEGEWAVVTDDNPENNGYYRWGEGEWVRSTLQPADSHRVETLEQETQVLNRLVQGTDPSAPLEAVVDEEGVLLRLMTPTLHRDSVHDVSGVEGQVQVLGDDGAIGIWLTDEWNHVGPLVFGYTDLPGVYVVDAEGVVLGNLSGQETEYPEEEENEEPASALSEGLVFSPVLVGAQDVPITIYPAGMLRERHRAGEMVATLSSPDTEHVINGSDLLTFTTDQLGSSAYLTLRTRNAMEERALSLLTLKTVPIPAAEPQPFNVLVIGDSIANRQGPQLLKQWLEAWGYLPHFIGTFPSSASAASANDTTGPMNESREGWETGDYTLAVNNRVNIVLPGEEAGYMAMDKPTQWTYNPFLRAATAEDLPEDIRNGYVMDFSFYQTRFSLPTPDVIVWALGTNDVRDLSAEVIQESVRDNDRLFYRRVAAAWPDAKIIRSLPSTAIQPARDALWKEKYFPMIHGMLEAVQGNTQVTVAPTWALANLESGYNWPVNSVDSVTGFAYPATFSDAVHPARSGRTVLYRTLAPYVAAASLGFI